MEARLGPLGNQNFAFANQAGLDSNVIVGTHIHFLQLDISDSAKIAHITASSSRDRRVMRYYVERLTIGDQLELFRMKYADQMLLQSHMIDYLSILLCIQCSGTGNQIVRRGGENWRIWAEYCEAYPLCKDILLPCPTCPTMHALLTNKK